MFKAASKRSVKNAMVSLFARLPRSAQIRLFGDLARLLSDHAGEAFDLLPDLPDAQEALQRAASNFLPHATEALATALALLPRDQQVLLFRKLAGSLDVTGGEVVGRNGTLAGYFDDNGIFGPYLLERAWFVNAIELVNSIFQRCAGGTFLDIGANIGAVVVPIAKTNPHVSCYAFEPEPNNFLALAHNIARNGVRANVKAYELALANSDGVVTFELDRANFGDHRLRKPGTGSPMFNEEARATIEVPARRLDGILAAEQLTTPILVKMDVQGAELMVLKGGEATLRTAELALVEYWPYGIRRLGSEPREFLKAFSGMFAFAAKVGEHAVTAADFVPFQDMVAELERFAEAAGAMHLNLVLTKRPPAAAFPDASTMTL